VFAWICAGIFFSILPFTRDQSAVRWIGYGPHERGIGNGHNGNGYGSKNHHIAPQLAGAQLVFSGDRWPQRAAPVHLSGLACDSSLDDHVFASERFGVHELRLDEGGKAADVGWREKDLPLAKRISSIDSCLGQMPSFPTDGLRGISLDCNVDSDCDVLI